MAELKSLIESLASGEGSQDSSRQAQGRASRVMTLIRSYMSSGHFKADIDPLNLKQAYKEYGSKVRTQTFDE